MLERRPMRDDIAPDPDLPADTALWARLQSVSGGLWGGCVYDAGGDRRAARRRRRAHDPDAGVGRMPALRLTSPVAVP